MRVQQVCGTGFFDIKKIVLRRHFTERDNFNAVGFSLWGIEKQIFKVVAAFRLHHVFAKHFDIVAILHGIGDVHDMTGLIESLSPSGRRRLSAELAKRLRQNQQRRVMAQKAPDGTPYAPRQQQRARKKTGRVKRKMFAKLITSRFLHIRASPEQASMEFYGGKSPKIASVHQFGLSEENRKDGKKIDYPARPLLGFTGEDVQMIEEIILAHLER